MIEVANLTKKFEVMEPVESETKSRKKKKLVKNTKVAVDNISFSVEEGELLILIGTSGCGKTTTLKMINRLVEPDSGTILIRGQDIREQKVEELRKGIGYVIQNIGLFPHYTVAQNIAVVPRLLHWDPKRIARRTEELLEMVALKPEVYLEKNSLELSGGEAQRVGLARGLAADPKIILLDEPFGALDPITRGELQQEFQNLQTKLRKTMVLVTHDMFEAAELGDRICLMDKGKIQQIGTPKELLFFPQSDFVSDFFASHRFQLELKVLKINDIVDEIPRREVQSDNIHEIRENTNLLDVLERAEQIATKTSVLQIVDKTGKPMLRTTCEDVLAAFYKTKAKMVGAN